MSAKAYHENFIKNVTREMGEVVQLRANALNAVRAALVELGEVILKENFSWPSDVFAKDLSSWRNVLDAYGYKPDGSVKKIKPKKEAA